MSLSFPRTAAGFPSDLERDRLRRALAPARHNILDPRAVGRQGPVGVGIVLELRLERSLDWRGGRLRLPVLGTAGRIGQSRLDAERGQEAIALGGPFRRARLEVEDVTQEVLRRGVLVQPADQVGNGAVKILRPHDGRIEQQTAGARVHGPGLVIGHALEHLELDPGLDVVALAQHQTVRDVEEVVAGDTQMDGLRVLGPAAVLEHALVIGVHLDLGLVRSLGPAVLGGLDALHGQIRALDDAELDRRAATGPAPERPLGEGSLHAM